MAYNYLSLVNDVNRSLNEVELDETNFSTATGWYNQAKNSVLFAIQQIHQEGVAWPFNHTTVELPLTVNVSRYNFPSDLFKLSTNSFRIKGDTSLNVITSPLFEMDYEDYIRENSDMEYRPEIYACIPRVVFRTPSSQFGVSPAPDKSYTLVYEYYKNPAPLELWSDVPTIPEAFRYTITEGAMHFAYRFRGDIELSDRASSKFEQAISRLRAHYINRNEYLRSSMRY